MRKNSLFWGIALLLAGGILLLEPLGVLTRLELSAWQLIWPVFLVYLGIWVLLGFSRGQRRAVTDVCDLAIPCSGATAATISLAFGAGTCSLSAGAAPGMLFTGTCEGGAESAVTQTPEGHVNLEVHSTEMMVGPWNWPTDAHRRWDLHVNDSLPITLQVKTGASDTHLDLTELKVTKLRIDSGASSTEIRLPAAAGYTEVRGSSGAASLKLFVPQGVAARIRATGALSGIHIDRQRFPESEGIHVSPDFESTPNRVDIRLDVGVGSIEIR